MDLQVVDIGVRGAWTGVSVLIALLLWMSRIDRQAQLAFTLCSVAIIARLWSNVPPPFEMMEPWSTGMRMIGAFGAFGITWLMISIFLDDKRATWLWLLSGLAISILVVVTSYFREFVPFLRGYAVVHFIALLWLVIGSGRGDLSNARRRLRPVLATLIGIFCVGQALVSTPMIGNETVGYALGQSTTAFLVLFCFGLWALRTDLNRWPGRLSPPEPSTPSPAEIHEVRSALVERIEKAMADGIWRQEGLTVAALAQQVNAPEHRVRKAINQRLGYRNFASFINGARIEAAKAQLASPQDAEKTVLEIAYGVGFGSLGPFNRAFREETGRSPTQYRAEVGLRA